MSICLGFYDTHNNCNGVSGVNGGGDPGSALSPLRTTQYAYTKDGVSSAGDGYFVLTTTDIKANALASSTRASGTGKEALVRVPAEICITRSRRFRSFRMSRAAAHRSQRNRIPVATARNRGLLLFLGPRQC